MKDLPFDATLEKEADDLLTVFLEHLDNADMAACERWSSGLMMEQIVRVLPLLAGFLAQVSIDCGLMTVGVMFSEHARRSREERSSRHALIDVIAARMAAR